MIELILLGAGIGALIFFGGHGSIETHNGVQHFSPSARKKIEELLSKTSLAPASENIAGAFTFQVVQLVAVRGIETFHAAEQAGATMIASKNILDVDTTKGPVQKVFVVAAVSPDVPPSLAKAGSEWAIV